jgi:hypothetical protein
MGRKSLTDFPWENPIPMVSLDNWITNLFRRIYRTKSESADYPDNRVIYQASIMYTWLGFNHRTVHNTYFRCAKPKWEENVNKIRPVQSENLHRQFPRPS